MRSGFNPDTVPTWDLSEAYPGFDSPEFIDAKQRLRDKIASLSSVFGGSPVVAESLKDYIGLYNEASDLYEDLFAFAYTQFSADTRSESAQKEIGKLEEIGLSFKDVGVRFRAALAEAESNKPGAVGEASSDPELAEYRFFLLEQLELSRRQMSQAEESLAADLSRAGGDSWERLQEAVSSTLSWLWDEQTGERKTVIELRSLAMDPDRKVRERAYEKELEAWKSVEVPMAFSLNGVKGFSTTLNTRRGYSSTLARSVRQSRISEATLDSLLQAMRESLPMFRRYFHTKAEIIGVKQLAFFDLFAPVGDDVEKWPFEKSRKMIETQFGAFSSEMGAMATKAFEKRWIDARPREGKVGGAYCISFPLTKSSRILCNYSGTFSDLTTVAHELGHAFHHEVLKDASSIHRQYPMTLAETASIFAENIIYGKALETVPPAQQITVLEEFLQGASQVIVDILSRFLFEQSVLDRRSEGELSPRELCDLMLAAQRETYGDGLDEARLHPYMWAVKSHYYRQDLAFYNFPYAFGLLFGLGLYSLYLEEGDAFAARYRGVLEMTGRASAEEVTRSVGFDIEKPDFWRSGIEVVRRRVDRFVELGKKGNGA